VDPTAAAISYKTEIWLFLDKKMLRRRKVNGGAANLSIKGN
jgi:hypothetical protein